MATQNQPSSGGSGGSTAVFTVTHRNGEPVTPVDEQGTLPASQRQPFPVADAAKLRDKQGGKHGQSIVTLIQWMVQKVKEYLKVDKTDFGAKFSVMYHNHDIPIPLPLTPFITNLSVNEIIDAPYTTATINLKLPFEHIQVLFKNGGGRLDTGGFISIRQKSAPTSNNKIDDPLLRSEHFLTHLLVITNISYSLTTDTNTGLIMTNLTLACGSFISPLITGQYVVSPTVHKSLGPEDPRIRKDFGQINRSLDALGVPADSPKRRAFTRSFSTKRQTETKGDLVSEFFFDNDLYNQFLQLVVDGSIIRKDNGKDLKDVLTFLGYPKFPTSLTAKFTLEQWVADIEKELDKGAVSYIRLLRTQGVSEKKIKQIGKDILAILDEVTKNPDPTKPGVFESREVNRAVQYRDVEIGDSDQEFATQRTAPGDTTVAARLLQEELVRGEAKLPTSGEFTEGFEQRIGDVIRVISSTQDFPSNIQSEDLNQFPWVQGLAAKPLFSENLNKINNLYSKGQTIWGACISTFQPDDKTHELFPVIIPITNKRWYAAANDYERKLGGIVALIYRKKPMHPYIQINKDSLNAEYQNYQRIFSSEPPKTAKGQNEPYYRNITYTPQSEMLRENQEGFMSIDSVINNSNVKLQNEAPEKVKEYFPDLTYMPVLPFRDVIDFNFSYNESVRVNGVQVMHPYSLIDPKAGDILTEPYINVYDASRYGLRYYQTNYPFQTLSPKEKGAVNESNSTAERLYMTMGDGSKYAEGTLIIFLETTYAIKQGCWIAVNFSDKANTEFMNVKSDRMNYFICYVNQISYDLQTDPITGNILARSIISYSRGSWGGIIPELPAYRTISFEGEQKQQAITSTVEKRPVSPRRPQQQPQTKVHQATASTVRFHSDEWGSYGDPAALERRNEAFFSAFTNLPTNAVISKSFDTKTATQYLDLDNDGFFEWYQHADGNFVFIPKDKRPAVKGFTPAPFTKIVGEGFITPITVNQTPSTNPSQTKTVGQ